jgi:hypothetical protein
VERCGVLFWILAGEVLKSSAFHLLFVVHTAAARVRVRAA